MARPKPEYSAAEIASNVFVVGVAMVRGGNLTDRQKRRLDRNRDSAQQRAEERADKRRGRR